MSDPARDSDGFQESTHPFTNNLHSWVSFAGVACDSVALVHTPAVIGMIGMRTKREIGDAHGLTVMYDFVKFARDIAATPFPPAIS